MYFRVRRVFGGLNVKCRCILGLREKTDVSSKKEKMCVCVCVREREREREKEKKETNLKRKVHPERCQPSEKARNIYIIEGPKNQVRLT